MVLSLLLLLAQPPTIRQLLELEHQRAENVAPLLEALRSEDEGLRRQAARTAGRLERAELQGAVAPLVGDPSPEVRREAVAALAQMKAPFDFGGRLDQEEEASVRAVIYEALGRVQPPDSLAERVLVQGLREDALEARRGAARGLEWRVRVNSKTLRPEPSTIEGLRRAVRENSDPSLLQFALLALNAAGDKDAPTFDAALRHPDPQVRRLAVLGSKRWVEDPAPMVRLEAMKLAGDCGRAFGAIDRPDPGGHVVLAAVDRLGAQKCDPTRVMRLVDESPDWRIRAHALVALAHVSPEAARERLPKAAAADRWQVRAYAARTAVLLEDAKTLAALARDPSPNVVLEALSTAEDAVRALASDHSGLLFAAAEKLVGSGTAKEAAPLILATLQRLSRAGRVTNRDPRVKLIEVLGESADAGLLEALRPLLSDPDPAVAAAVAAVLSKSTGRRLSPITTHYVPAPFPSEEELQALRGARAIVTMKGLGEFRVSLLPGEAPAAVATFVQLAETGAYDGLTFHRVVPNFVVQGGSPGADEYEARTTTFMRDELGLTSHRRGTLGISTRGHDTGDGQIFINLVDNWRLDHTYTVFAQVDQGIDVVDRILEGDVIESIRILRPGSGR